ncbi:MAG: hypothetical protein BGO77_07040 [Caedibacter sp. 37-49]|nr:MAG: hypothetical protein BGO77_07040 [Caedibacter sp. 37-49]
MFREIKDKFHKTCRVFAAGLLLSTLYSKTSIAVENPLENRYSSSIVATKIIYFLSHFFPVLHSLLENMLPKHINDNQQLLYSFGNFKGGISSSSGLSSVGGKYKNSQFSLHDLKPRLISFSPSLSSSCVESSVFVGSLESKYQNIDSNSSRNETFIPNLGHFYSPMKNFLPFHEKRRENFISEYIPITKQGFSYVSNETHETKSKVSFSSYDSMLITAKNLSSNLLTKTKETKQDLPFESINDQSKEQENFKVKPNNQHVNEFPIKSIVAEVQEHHLENRTEETVYVKEQSQTTSRVDTLAELSKMSELQPEQRPNNQNEKRSELKIERNFDTTQKLSLEKEVVATVKEASPSKSFKNAAASWAANLSPERKRLSPLPAKAPKKKSLAPHQLPFKIEFESAEKQSHIEGFTPPPPPMVRLLSQPQLRNDKSSINHVKELDLALQKGGLKLPKESGILLALQKLVKDQKLKVEEVQNLVVKLSEQVSRLVERVFKFTIKESEDYILRLIQPHHNIETFINFSQGFKEIAEATLALWRTKLLTDYIEKGEQELSKKQSLLEQEIISLINKVVMERFEQAINPELGSQLKRNAKIIITPTVQNSPLYESGMFSSVQKKEILAQVFKLLVSDSSFKLPTLTNSQGNPSIDTDELKKQIQPYMVLAVGQLYGTNLAARLSSNIVQSDDDVSESLTPSILSSVSAEDILKQLDSWLTDKLLGLLPGNSLEEKLNFWFSIADQDRTLSVIRLNLKKAQNPREFAELKDEEEKVNKRTYQGIMQSIFIELGAQKFSGSELQLQDALYRDVKRLIEDYLHSKDGFLDAIRRTDQGWKKANTALEMFKLVSRIANKKRYVIKARANGTSKSVETPMLEVPNFVFLFSLPSWRALKDLLKKNEETKRLKEEREQLQKQLLVKKLSQLFLKEELRDIAKSSEQIAEDEKENLPIKRVQTTQTVSAEITSSKENSQADLSPSSKKHLSRQEKGSPLKTSSSPLKPIDLNMIAAPPPPPLPRKSKIKTINPEVKIKQDLQKLLEERGLTVKPTSALLTFLVQYKLTNHQSSSSRIVEKFFNESRKIFYQVIGVTDEKQAYEKFASQLGLENSNDFVQRLTQNLDKELQNYFLTFLTVENIESILTNGNLTSESLKLFNKTFLEKARTFLELNFKQALKQFEIENETDGVNQLILFLKDDALKAYTCSNEEKLNLVLGTFAYTLAAREQDHSFSFPSKKYKKSKENKGQFVLNIEAFKPVLVKFLNKVIIKKFNGEQPSIEIPTYVEDIEIEPSKVLPCLGDFFVMEAFKNLDGETQELKINNLIKDGSKKNRSLIDNIFKSLFLKSCAYKTAEGIEDKIIFTQDITKGLKGVIIERYKGFAASLDGSCRSIMLRSADPFSLFTDLIKNQLGTLKNSPKTHTLSMFSHKDDKKIEMKEIISSFDILLSLPILWENKKNLELRKQREVEEQRLKELTMARRVQTLQKFIQSELEIQS